MSRWNVTGTTTWGVLVGAALATSLALAAGDGESSARRPGPALADMAWIAGSWETTGAAARVEERWTPPAGGAMLGMSRTLKDGRMTEFEFLRIVERDGELVYVAQPGGRPPTEFVLTSFDGKMAVFENPKHDFPKRITYARHRDGTLTARVDGGPGTDGPSFAFRAMK
jgi:hypothetical protein